MPVPLPDERTRWRCTRCGNLTRFGVVRSRRTAEFWHFDLAGDPTVEQTQVLSEDVLEVRCRWCDAVDSVQVEPRPAAQPDQPRIGTIATGGPAAT